MKILVVGGAGYIGSVCAELLLDDGHTVCIFDNLSEGHRAAVDSRAEFIEGDLTSSDEIESALTDGHLFVGSGNGVAEHLLAGRQAKGEPIA